MQDKSNDRAQRKTRRAFLKSTGVVAAGLTLAGLAPARAAKETLAVEGGSKAITYPDDKHSQASRWPLYSRDEEEAVLELVRHPSYEPIGLLERDWKTYTKSAYVKAHCNGTSALASMFFALDLPPGSEIIVPSYTFFATIVPMRLFGLVPVFVDINPLTLNLDLEDTKTRLTKNTRAILPVHWIGLPCDMDHIQDWAREKGLIVLEDAAHAQGAELKGKKMGTWARTGIFSYRLQHNCPLYRESGWWHHKPVIPELPGSEQANATAIPLPYFTSEVPELLDQYVEAFEKVWAHRKTLV